MANIGDRVTVCMITAVDNAPWLRTKLKYGIPVQLEGTVKRIAGNGKIGVQFDNAIFSEVSAPEEVRGAYNLHGAGRMNYSLYVVPESIIDPAEHYPVVRSQEEISEEIDSVLRKIGNDDVLACI